MGKGPLSGAYDSLAEKLIDTPSPEAFNRLLDKNTNLLDGALLEAFDRLIKAAGESEKSRIIEQIKEFTRRRICDAIFRMLLERMPDISVDDVRPHLDILLSDAGAYTLHALKNSLGSDAAKTKGLELLSDILQHEIYQQVKTTLSATGILKFLKNASLYLIDEKLQHRFLRAMADPEFDNRRQNWITLFFSKATYMGPEAAFKDVSLEVLHFLGPEGGGGLLTTPQRLEQLSELADLTHGEPQAWSGAQFFIGEIYLGMGKAGSDEDIQRAIRHYEEALTVMDRERNATYWTRVQLAIGKAWLQRDGDIRTNQEKAKEAFGKVSDAMPRERSAMKWASNQMEMGIAWYKSPRGGRDQNLPIAIGHYQQAGEVYTIEFNKVGYNNVEYNLGLAFYYLNEPDRAANVRQSLDHFGKSRATLDSGREAGEADIDYYMGNLYGEQFLAGDAASLQPAIRHLESAMLSVPGSIPGYGYTQMLLADLYLKDDDDFLSRIGQARDCYEAAASALDPADDLSDWISAHVQAARLSLLGSKNDKEAAQRAIGHYEGLVEFLGQDQRSEIPWYFFCDIGEAFLLLENGETSLKALSFFEEAVTRYPVDNGEKEEDDASGGLRIYDRDFLLTRIGYMYSILREGNVSDNIEKGIAWHQLALEASDENKRPLVWAAIQNNLGVAYADRLAGDPTENQEEALRHYELALSRCPPTDILWGDIQFNMAKTWCERKRGDHAANIEKGSKV